MGTGINIDAGKQAGKVSFSSRVFGVPAQQNPVVILHFNDLLRVLQPKTIIEFGTAGGGLTCLLGLYCSACDATMHTFDISKKTSAGVDSTLRSLGTNVHITDIFSNVGRGCVAGILSECKRPVLLLCDNGNKIREVNEYSILLKSGDVIMAHDYSRDRKFFESEVRGKYWNWCEITYDDVSSAMMDFKPYMQEFFVSSAWMSMVRK